MKLAVDSVFRVIRRPAMIAWFGVALLALNVPIAQADSPGSAPAASATTLPATDISVDSAVLNALIETRGQATHWEFQYGATTDHDHSTSLSLIPAGGGTIRVSETITGLRARTTYHFRAIAMSGIGSNYSEVYYAADGVFTTRSSSGALLLAGRKLRVSRQVVAARLKCASKRACAGRFSITTLGQGHSSPTMACATKSFRIAAGRTRGIRASLRQACLTLLASAPHHQLRGGFSSATSTGQRGQSTPVELILR